MKSILKAICIIVDLVFCINVKAQQPSEFFQSPKITPASPEASALFKFSEAPVDYSSGVATQSIPLYTLQAGKIVCPISISYSTGGIRVQDVASMVGLGWNLSWGGIIYQQGEILSNTGNTVDASTVKTEADVQAHITEDVAWTHLYSIAQGYSEKQKPEYIFNFGEYSGSFFYDVNNVVHIKSGNPNLKIEQILSPDHNPLKDGFKITTDKGIQYTFLVVETALPTSSAIRKTAYFVSGIRDLNSSDYIDFTYVKKATFQDNSSETYNDFRITSSTMVDVSGCSWPGASTASHSTNYTSVYSSVISSIASSNGSVVFTSAADRLDLDPTRITDMTVYNSDNSIVKKVKFNQSYFVSDANKPKVGFRLKLDGLSFYNTNIATAEKYDFAYNSLILPAYANIVNGQNCTGVDYWGFYNGAVSNTGLIPSSIASANGFINCPYLGDRNVYPNYTQACTLQKITYPTGGYLQFTFENNTIVGSPLGSFTGGLRLKRSAYYANSSSPSLTKEYKYNNAIIPLYQISNNYVYDKRKLAGCGPYGGCQGCGSTFYYTKNISSSPIGAFSYFNLSVFYWDVEEFTVSGNNNIGKTEYTYNIPEYVTQYTDIPEFGGVVAYERKWANEKLLKTIQFFRRDLTNNYVLVKKQENTYTDYNDISSIIGMYSVRSANTDYVNNPSYFTAAETNQQRVNENLYGNSYNSSGIRLLTSQKVTEYLEGNIRQNFTSYEYEPVKYQLKKATLINSDNENIITLFKYPYEASTLTNITATETSVLNSMVAQNNITQPVEKEIFRNTLLTERSRIIYDTWNLSQYPKTYMRQNGNGTLQNKNEITKYDTYGNVSEYKAENNISNAVIFKEYGHYPIAEITNATQIDVAYTSFEKNEILYPGTILGNWIITNYYGPPDATQANVPMGKYCLPTTATTSFTKSGLTASVSYYVSYWSKAGSYTVTGTITLKQGKTINGWTNYTHTISGVTATSVSGVASYIDELRLYPSTAQMTTYDQLPSIGVAAICNINNVITRYEYDDMGYLTLVRDENNNIIKMISKAYRQVTVNSGTIYNNVQKIQSFAKNDCTTGGTGSVVPYTVPANTYSSTISQDDADVKAQNQINTNGQGNANTQGNCTFFNTIKSKYVTRNTCITGTVGTTVNFIIAANIFSSTISQVDAETQAQNALATQSISYANSIPCVSAASTIAVNYNNQSSVYWTLKATNVTTAAVTSSTMGSYYSGTIFSALPSGTYNLVFSSNGITPQAYPLQVTLNGDVQTFQPPFSSNTIITSNNIIVTSGSLVPLIKLISLVPLSGCTLSSATGWTVQASNISGSSGTEMNFAAAVTSSGMIFLNGTYTIGTINGSCNPSAARSFNVTESGRTWTVTVDSYGSVSVQFISGTPPPPGTSILLSGAYSL